MVTLISAQRHYMSMDGIWIFINRYSKLLNNSSFLTYRRNILKPHLCTVNLSVNSCISKSSIFHIHSIMDSNVFNGPIDKYNGKKIYFCHHLISEEICYYGQSILMQQKYEAQSELFRKCNQIVFLTHHHKNKAIRDFPQLKNKFTVVYHGIKSNYNNIQKSDNILYVGRISREKGITDLIKACKLSNKSLRIIGDIDSPYGKEIQPLLDKIEYTTRNWIYDRSEIYEEISKAQLVVLPAHLDCFNMVGIEAIVCGTPLLVSDIPVFRELYIDKNLAESFKVGDINDLAKKLTHQNPIMNHLPQEYTEEHMMNKINSL
ncbi:glycosyltransferase family 4 protein [Candidatus Woesearchaeota archaeon]|nr:glycosyltransferase family 4 protein [Candidatus Woesearchaeota archaeon]